MKTLSAEELHQEGVRYYYGNGVKANEEKAIECFEQAIAIGNLPQSKYALGAILVAPSSISKIKEADTNRGTALILEAAEEGHSQAMAYVANTFGVFSY